MGYIIVLWTCIQSCINFQCTGIAFNWEHELSMRIQHRCDIFFHRYFLARTKTSRISYFWWWITKKLIRYVKIFRKTVDDVRKSWKIIYNSLIDKNVKVFILAALLMRLMTRDNIYAHVKNYVLICNIGFYTLPY